MKSPLKFLSRVSLLRAPSLSPSTVNLKVLRWHARVGETLPPYSLLCDVSTSSLVRIPSNELVDETTELHLEVQEEVILAKIYVEIGQVVPVGMPLALLCEDLEDVKTCSTISASDADTLEQQKNSLVVAALWQAYLINSSTEKGCS